MDNRREATSGVTSTLTCLIDENFNENEENMSGGNVSGSDSDASERVSLDGLNMDGIEVDELCDSDNSVRLNPNDPTDQTWHIRSSNPNHTCSKVYKNRNVTSAWIGEQYKEKFIADPDYSLKSLQQDVKRDFCCLVSLTKCRRAKLKVLKLIEGAHKAQYEKIYEYLLEMILKARGKPILTMMEMIRTKIMLLIVKKKEEADK
ncbi:hypothetical protein J1N35_038806 [Gossypium stocksii]|uniref:Uncharacterized protein n=1 Tax=Gossypium stocksii TaxID=47602 RepID=A0A9D3UMM5_9ROSI|nr:hypothetical protein J1N35_038806 [Gossypium stocksii]